MRSAFRSVLGALLAAGIGGAGAAQTALQPPLPSSAPASAAAGSRATSVRSPAVRAAEKAQEPGVLAPEQRVVPQITVPLKPRAASLPAAPPASLPAGTVPGIVNDGAARCLASASAREKAACEAGKAASSTRRT